MAQPRRDIPDQFFRNAELLGSNDKKSWVKIADIIQKTVPRNNDLRNWNFDNKSYFRYYKLMIYDGYFEQPGKFFSMAMLAIFD